MLGGDTAVLSVLYARLCHALLVYRFFSRWRPPAILDLWRAFWDDPHRVFGGLYHFPNFVGITAVALIIWKFKYFACLAIPALKIGVLGAFDSLSKVQYHRDFEMHIRAHKHVT